jgi:hypothetical protein
MILKFRSKLGRWIVTLQEVTNEEEEIAIAVSEGRGNPKQPSARYAEIKNAIQFEKNNLTEFLETDFEPDEYEVKALRFLGRIGHLIGYNVPFLPGEIEELQEEADAENLEEILNEDSTDGVSSQEENDNEFSGQEESGDEPDENEEVEVGHEEVDIPIRRANPRRGFEDSE